MIHTGYFANIKKITFHYIPVSICAKPPKGYKGLEYKKLAPSYSILMEYKRDPDETRYIKRFESEILDKLDPHEVVKDLLILTGNNKGLDYSPDIVLVCYEKASDFCHRHLIANWLNEYDYQVKEVKF